MNKFSLLVLASMAISTSSFAQGMPSNPDGWQYNLSAGVVAGPKSIGSDKMRYMAIPSLDIQYKNWFFLNPIEGVGVKTSSNGLTTAISLAPDFNSREPNESGRFHGLNNVNHAAAVRVKLDYDIDEFTTSAVISSRLGNSEKRGTTLALEAGYNVLATSKILFNAGVSAKAMDGTFAKNMLSISEVESLNSGLPAYQAKSGLFNTGVYGQVVYRIDDHWSIFSKLELTRLQGDAGKSPFIEKRTATNFLAFANYAF